MKKRIYVTAVLVIAAMCISLSMTAFAETTPVDVIPTESAIATVAPTTAATVPTETSPVENATGTTSATSATDTSAVDSTPASSVPDTTASAATTVHTNPPEPTEPDEDSTYSDYVSPAPVYTPADQDFEENDWEEIELDLGAEPADGKGSFAYIQENNRKGNDSIMHFLIIGIVLLFLAIAGFTFVILYKPKALAKAKTSKKGTRYAQSSNPYKSTKSDTRSKRQRDDYDDGYY